MLRRDEVMEIFSAGTVTPLCKNNSMASPGALPRSDVSTMTDFVQRSWRPTSCRERISPTLAGSAGGTDGGDNVSVADVKREDLNGVQNQ